MKRESTKEFILLLKSGDEFAFTELVNKYNKRLFAYAISLSGDYSLAKDIVQDVFVKTYEFRKRLNPEFSISGFLVSSVSFSKSVLLKTFFLLYLVNVNNI